jgi:hypothetical protein
MEYILRTSGASDCGSRLLPWQAQSEALAIAVDAFFQLTPELPSSYMLARAKKPR